MISFNKLIVIFGFILLLTANSFVLINLNSIEVENESPVVITDKIPSFEFLTTDTLAFTNYELDAGKPIVFMYMDPTCSDCDAMFQKMFRYYSEFDAVHLIMATEADVSQVIKFNKKYKIDTYSNIDVVLDKSAFMFKQYGLVEYPTFVIYDSEQNHIKTLDELVTFSVLVKYVREAVKKSSKQNS